MAIQPGLCRTWSETQIVGVLTQGSDGIIGVRKYSCIVGLADQNLEDRTPVDDGLGLNVWISELSKSHIHIYMRVGGTHIVYTGASQNFYR